MVKSPRAGIYPTLVARLERYSGPRLTFEIDNILALQLTFLVLVPPVEGTSAHFSNAWLGVLIRLAVLGMYYYISGQDDGLI